LAHILLIDVPGGNDFSVLEDAIAAGHRVSFATSDHEHYTSQGGETERYLGLFHDIIETKPFTYEAFEQKIMASHAIDPFDAVICLIDIRQIEASKIAQRLGLLYTKPDRAVMLRNKAEVRACIAKAGLRQPAFFMAETGPEIRSAAHSIGFPVVVKPVDGYASQNIFIIRTVDELDHVCQMVDDQISNPSDYGLGVSASNRYSVETYLEGTLIGCDVFSDGKQRLLLGVNEKRMYPPPSFAILGSQFPSKEYMTDEIREYAFALLDTVGYDVGAAHIEMIVANGLPYLVEINARLVSAQIPFQMAYAFQRSLYVDLIDLHLGVPISAMAPFEDHAVSAIRWIVADSPGVLEELHFPDLPDPSIKRVTVFKRPGDPVKPPMSNSDRIAYVIATGPTAVSAVQAAEAYIAASKIVIT
jgi:biotin carboxylase